MRRLWTSVVWRQRMISWWLSVWLVACADSAQPVESTAAGARPGCATPATSNREHELPRDFLARRTAGFYTTGLLNAVVAVTTDTIDGGGMRFSVAQQASEHVARAAAYELQARRLLVKVLGPQSDGETYVPSPDVDWAAAVERAASDAASYRFTGLPSSGAERELARLVDSEAFDRVRSEAQSRSEHTMLWHHGYVWVPMMVLLNHLDVNLNTLLPAVEKERTEYSIIDVLARNGGLGESVVQSSRALDKALGLLEVDGLVERVGGKIVATVKGAEGLPKLARWSGLLASYHSLANGLAVAEWMRTPGYMVRVDDRRLNVASSGAGLERFANEFMLKRLQTIKHLSTVVGVGTGSGELEKLIHDRFSANNRTLDIFGSDLDMDDLLGRSALDVARETLAHVPSIQENPGRIFQADVLKPDVLFDKVRAQYTREYLAAQTPPVEDEVELTDAQRRDLAARIQTRLDHSAVTSAFITHEPRSLSDRDAITMLQGYAEHTPNFLLLEIPLIDADVHAQQSNPHFGAEIIVFHLASGQTIRPLETWVTIAAQSGYSIAERVEFNRLQGADGTQYPSYIGLHLQR
jgi:hypothetical protein